ncbi:UBC-like protein [Wolfiporia cocos MD-104 SS10]|uniref:UBC-like protein n=1 Tax=Wolfiporia cocos (strain MD-104) TaxID=742152 RepID=A0A2H3JH83_WOLCO|nr:UBC-like protein [Wolfiporia cocos MD-104 SS10]
MLGISNLVSSPTLDFSAPSWTRHIPRLSSSSSIVLPAPAADAQSTAVARAAVAAEYASIPFRGHCPLGMYMTPSPMDLLVWDAVFFVHQGYYADAILKFRITFPPDYPERPPAVRFLTDVFHPLVTQQDGTFNLAPRFKPWKPKEHHSFDVLHWIKAAFKKHALDEIKEADCLNKEAYRRYHESTSSFAALATQSSQLSQTTSALFDSDHPSKTNRNPHKLQFRELEPEKLDELRAHFKLHDWSEVQEP